MIYRKFTLYTPLFVAASSLFAAWHITHQSVVGNLLLLALGVLLLILAMVSFAKAEDLAVLMEQRSLSPPPIRRLWLPARWFHAHFYKQQIRVNAILAAIIALELLYLGGLLLSRHHV